MNEVKKGKNPKKNLTLSVIFFLIVVLATVWIKLYSNSIEAKNEKLQMDIDEVVASINEIKKDEKTQIYELLQRNKKAIERKELLSDIPNFVGTMKQMSEDFEVEFDGFAYSNGVISCETKASTDNASLAYQKTAKFIKDYRASEEAIFNIGFINAFDGTNEMMFNVELEVK